MGRIEVEVGDRLGVGQVKGGRLVDVEAGVGVEAEVLLGRAAGGPRAGERGGEQPLPDGGVGAVNADRATRQAEPLGRS